MKFKLQFLKKKKIDENVGSVYRIMWKRFLKNGLNVFFLFILAVVSLISFAGYLITPDPTPFANRQHLELALQKPGFEVLFLKIRNQEHTEHGNFLKTMMYGRKDQYNYLPLNDYHINGDSVSVELYTGMSPNEGPEIHYHLRDFVTDADPEKSNIDYSNKQTQLSEIQLVENFENNHLIRRKYILGTDRFGRDVLSQLIIGARVSLAVGFISVIVSLLIGVGIGAAAGYFGGRTDRFVLWLINVVWAIPTLFLVIAITFALGKGFWQIFIAVGLTLWVEIARLVRGLVISVKNREYVEAARALGYSNSRIIINHILPATLGPVIVVSAANFSSAILIESGLSFLGIGIQPPMPSWGTMLRENYGFLIMDYAYLAIIPGLAIMLLVLTFMVIGNGIRDAMEIRGE